MNDRPSPDAIIAAAETFNGHGRPDAAMALLKAGIDATDNTLTLACRSAAAGVASVLIAIASVEPPR